MPLEDQKSYGFGLREIICPYEVSISHIGYDVPYSTWIKNNLKGIWYVDGYQKIGFEKEEDAVAFKLYWA